MRGLASWFCFLFLMVALAGCGRLDPPGPTQPLVVGLPANPVFQRTAAPEEGLDGFSRDLVDAFAGTMGVGTRFVIAADYPTLLEMVRTGKVHMAAALPAPEADDPQISLGPPLYKTRQVIVQHADALPVDSPEKLAGREILLLAGAPQAGTLRALGVTPMPVLQERTDLDEIELLASVASRRHELAASDELHFTMAANYHPDLKIALVLPETLAYVWAFPAANGGLKKRADDFITAAGEDGTMRRLNDRYFSHAKRLDLRDVEAFLQGSRGRLSDYRHFFQEAQAISGIDWRLLAALAYQESKWDPLATSPTGVRGMMMLTEDTADRLNVANRLDAQQSIRAGAKYLAYLMDELPDEIKPPDRLWFALAAYNLGMGHLGGARQFAPGLKRDPNLWVDMKQVLPLMARPEYYTRLKSGRARGGEAVVMVENVRRYYEILLRFEPVHTPASLSGGKKPVLKTRLPPKRKKKPATPQR